MKRLMALAAIVLMATGAFALEHTITFSAQAFYTTYIQNEAFRGLAAAVTPRAASSYEKVRLQLWETADNVKFNFDGRLYLYSDGSPLRYAVDNAYAQVSGGEFILYFGRQRIKWGTGFAWNPSDLLQTATNVLDPENNLVGIDAVRAEYSNGFITPSLILSVDPADYTEKPGKNLKTALQLYKLVGPMDVFVNGIYRQDELQSAGVAVSWDAGLMVVNLEGAAVRFMNPGLTPLTLIGARQGDEALYRWLAGIFRNFGDVFSLTAEFYRNDWGLSNSEYESIMSTSGAALSQALGLKRDYISFNASYTWSEKIVLNLTGIFGLSDGTAVLYPVLSYVENTGWDVSLGLLENLSKRENAEGYFGMPFYNVAEFKFNAYF